MRAVLLMGCATFLLMAFMTAQVQADTNERANFDDLLELPSISLPLNDGSQIAGVSYTQDGNILATISIKSDKDARASIQLWDTSNWSRINTIEVNNDHQMALSRDGRWLATSDPEKAALSTKQSPKITRPIHIWDVRNGALIHTLNGHTDGIFSLAFSQDGTRLISSSLDETLRIWDISSERELFKLAVTYGRHITLMPDGHKLIVESGWSNDLVLKLIDVTSGKEIRALSLPTSGMVSGMSIAPDGQRVAIAGTDPRQIELLDIASGGKLPSLGFYKAGVDNVTISPGSGEILLDSTGGNPDSPQTQYNSLEIWNATGTVLRRLIRRTAAYKTGGTFCVSADGNHLAYGTETGIIEIWDVQPDAEKKSKETARKYAAYLDSLPHYRLADESESSPYFTQGEKYFYRTIPPDYENAFKSYQLAAENGYPEAAYKLGIMYSKGQGASKDFNLSIKWLRLAVELGNADAPSALVYPYRVLENKDQALMWAYVATSVGNQKKYAEENITELERFTLGNHIIKLKQLAQQCIAKMLKGCE